MGRNTVILERRFIPEGTLVMKQGEAGNSAYLIQSGSVIVYTEQNGKRIELARLGAGQIVGEMALVFDEKRVASVQALEDTNLIVITRMAFKDKLDKSDPTIKAIVEMMTKRMASTNNASVKERTDINALIETGQTLYQNILRALPEDKQDAFKDSVFPKFESFLDTLKKFQG